jgi:hypothetical protein
MRGVVGAMMKYVAQVKAEDLFGLSYSTIIFGQSRFYNMQTELKLLIKGLLI